MRLALVAEINARPYFEQNGSGIVFTMKGALRSPNPKKGENFSDFDAHKSSGSVTVAQGAGPAPVENFIKIDESSMMIQEGWTA